jgi:EAL domain-containing protein (putative c-di-GMP-specific phosphodiesterase class I)
MDLPSTSKKSEGYLPSLPPYAAHCSDSIQALWFLTGQLSASGAIRSLPIHSNPFTVGRRQDQHLCLELATVSAVHAEIADREGRLFVSDLGSTNGTYVNGRRIERSTELKENDIVQFASLPFRMRRQSSSFEARTLSGQLCDQALSLVQFDRLMNERAVTPYYQPLVDVHTLRVVGQEVIARSQIYGLEMPDAMFQAAAQLDLSVELSRMFRWEGIRCVASLPEPPMLFVNTHPCELTEPGLVESLQEIRKVSPRQPLVLEVHEAAATSASSMRELRRQLQDLNIQMAYDDFGAGRNRLIELIEVPPDYLKFDMGLIRNLEASQPRQQLLASLFQLTRELNILTVAEGVETAGEADACREVGFDLAQGFFYGRPAPAQQRV